MALGLCDPTVKLCCELIIPSPETSTIVVPENTGYFMYCWSPTVILPSTLNSASKRSTS